MLSTGEPKCRTAAGATILRVHFSSAGTMGQRSVAAVVRRTRPLSSAVTSRGRIAPHPRIPPDGPPSDDRNRTNGLCRTRPDARQARSLMARQCCGLPLRWRRFGFAVFFLVSPRSGNSRRALEVCRASRPQGHRLQPAISIAMAPTQQTLNAELHIIRAYRQRLKKELGLKGCGTDRATARTQARETGAVP